MNIKAHNIRGVSMLFRAIMKDKGGYFYRMMRNNIAWLNAWENLASTSFVFGERAI